jgi:hypothetical protein
MNDTIEGAAEDQVARYATAVRAAFADLPGPERARRVRVHVRRGPLPVDGGDRLAGACDVNVDQVGG